MTTRGHGRGRGHGHIRVGLGPWQTAPFVHVAPTALTRPVVPRVSRWVRYATEDGAPAHTFTDAELLAAQNEIIDKNLEPWGLSTARILRRPELLPMTRANATTLLPDLDAEEKYPGHRSQLLVGQRNFSSALAAILRQKIVVETFELYRDDQRIVMDFEFEELKELAYADFNARREPDQSVYEPQLCYHIVRYEDTGLDADARARGLRKRLPEGRRVWHWCPDQQLDLWEEEDPEGYVDFVDRIAQSSPMSRNRDFRNWHIETDEEYEASPALAHPPTGVGDVRRRPAHEIEPGMYLSVETRPGDHLRNPEERLFRVRSVVRSADGVHVTYDKRGAQPVEVSFAADDTVFAGWRYVRDWERKKKGWACAMRNMPIEVSKSKRTVMHAAASMQRRYPDETVDIIQVEAPENVWSSAERGLTSPAAWESLQPYVTFRSTLAAMQSTTTSPRARSGAVNVVDEPEAHDALGESRTTTESQPARYPAGEESNDPDSYGPGALRSEGRIAAKVDRIKALQARPENAGLDVAQLAAFDPTPQGRYLTWLVNLARRDEPIDARAHETLEAFDGIVAHLPPEARDINRVRSLDALDTLVTWGHDVVVGKEQASEAERERQRAETRRRRREDAAGATLGDSGLRMEQVYTFEQIQERNVRNGWCVGRDETHFDSYSEDPNARWYVITDASDPRAPYLFFLSDVKNELKDGDDLFPGAGTPVADFIRRELDVEPTAGSVNEHLMEEARETTSTRRMRWLATHPDVQVGLSLLSNEHLPTNIRRAVIEHAFANGGRGIGNMIHCMVTLPGKPTPQSILELVGLRMIEHDFGSYNYVLGQIIINVTDAGVLQRLADAVERASTPLKFSALPALSHSRVATPELLDRINEETLNAKINLRGPVERGLAGNPNSSPELLRSLAEEDRLYDKLAFNPSSPPDVQRTIIDSFSDFFVPQTQRVEKQDSVACDRVCDIARNAKTPEVLDALLTPLEAHYKRTPRVLGGRWGREAYFFKILEALAHNAHIDADTIARLRALDPELDQGLAKNPATPEDVLRDIAQSDDVHARIRIANNPRAPRDVLETLAADANTRVSERAAETLATLNKTAARAPSGHWVIPLFAYLNSLVELADGDSASEASAEGGAQSPKGPTSAQWPDSYTSENQSEDLDKLGAARSRNVVYHVGDLSRDRQSTGRESYEGDLLSVSSHPEAWIEIARLRSGRIYELSKPNARWLTASAATYRKAIAWAQQQGLLAPAQRYRVYYIDGETDEERFFVFSSLEEAEAEAEELDEARIEPVDDHVRADGQAAIGNDARQDALIEYAKAHNYDGVWWNDRLDINALSAPRGGITQESLPSWTVRDVTESRANHDVRGAVQPGVVIDWGGGPGVGPDWDDATYVGDGEDGAYVNVGEGDDGKWYHEVTIDSNSGGFTQSYGGVDGPYDTEDAARAAGVDAAKTWCIDIGIDYGADDDDDGSAVDTTKPCPQCGRDADVGSSCWWCGGRVARTMRPPEPTPGVYYHGTSREHLMDILTEGLRADSGAKWAPAVANDPELKQTPGVYVTTWFDQALRYAIGLSGDWDPVVLELRLDPTAVEPDDMDSPARMHWPKAPKRPLLRGQVPVTQFFFPGDIAPEAITAVYADLGDTVGRYETYPVPALAGETLEAYPHARTLYRTLKKQQEEGDVISGVFGLGFNVVDELRLAMDELQELGIDVAQYEDLLDAHPWETEDGDYGDYDGIDDAERQEAEAYKAQEIARLLAELHHALFTDEGVGYPVRADPVRLQRYTPEEALASVVRTLTAQAASAPSAPKQYRLRIVEKHFARDEEDPYSEDIAEERVGTAEEIAQALHEAEEDIAGDRLHRGDGLWDIGGGDDDDDGDSTWTHEAEVTSVDGDAITPEESNEIEELIDGPADPAQVEGWRRPCRVCGVTGQAHDGADHPYDGVAPATGSDDGAAAVAEAYARGYAAPHGVPGRSVFPSDKRLADAYDAGRYDAARGAPANPKTAQMTAQMARFPLVSTFE